MLQTQRSRFLWSFAIRSILMKKNGFDLLHFFRKKIFFYFLTGDGEVVIFKILIFSVKMLDFFYLCCVEINKKNSQSVFRETSNPPFGSPSSKTLRVSLIYKITNSDYLSDELFYFWFSLYFTLK